MPLNDLIDKVCNLCSAQKREIYELKAQNVELQKKLADAVVAQAADNTAYLIEAEAASNRLKAELEVHAEEEYAREQAALTARLETLLVPIAKEEPPVAFEQVAP